jgi:hypothetical protein
MTGCDQSGLTGGTIVKDLGPLRLVGALNEADLPDRDIGASEFRRAYRCQTRRIRTRPLARRDYCHEATTERKKR